MTASAAPADSPFPVEPEEDNSEYLLDLVTNDYGPMWHRAWESGDNRLRFRLGSNNVAQWFLEEELKLAASLVENRLRFRFRHTRLHRNSTERIGADTFEFEARVGGNVYASAFLTPASSKAENAVGVTLQHRRRTDRFSLLFVEFPNVARNFAEREKGGSDSLIVVFTDKPVRFGVRVREEPVPGLRVRLDAELVPEFKVSEEERKSSAAVRTESASARSLVGNVEYAADAQRRAEGGTALGFEFGYRSDDRDEATRRIGPESSARFPRGPGPQRLIAMEFDSDLYAISPLDSIAGWRAARVWVKPYVWLMLDDRWVIRCAVQFEEREIDRENASGASSTITNRYLVPIAGARFALETRRRSSVELGWASSFRNREERAGTVLQTREASDHRLYLAYEIALGSISMLRVIESFELDSEDRGTYGIHDHGFVQLIFGF